MEPCLLAQMHPVAPFPGRFQTTTQFGHRRRLRTFLESPLGFHEPQQQPVDALVVVQQ